MAFVGILSQIKSLFGPLVIQLVWHIIKQLFTSVSVKVVDIIHHCSSPLWRIIVYYASEMSKMAFFMSRQPCCGSHVVFPTTAETPARSLANFHGQYAGLSNEFIIYAMRQRERERKICYRKKQTDVSFSYVSPVIEHCQSSLRIHSVIASWIHSYFH